jgi:glutamyl-tRNA synthetase
MLAELIAPAVAVAAQRPLVAKEHELLLRSMASLKPRAKDLRELADGAAFLFRTRPIDMDERALVLLDEQSIALLGKVYGAITKLAEWSVPALEEAVKAVAEQAGIGLGKVAQPLRAALTGRATSPGIFDVLWLLGRDESLARISDRLQPAAA